MLNYSSFGVRYISNKDCLHFPLCVDIRGLVVQGVVVNKMTIVHLMDFYIKRFSQTHIIHASFQGIYGKETLNLNDYTNTDWSYSEQSAICKRKTAIYACKCICFLQI